MQDQHNANPLHDTALGCTSEWYARVVGYMNDVVASDVNGANDVVIDDDVAHHLKSCDACRHAIPAIAQAKVEAETKDDFERFVNPTEQPSPERLVFEHRFRDRPGIIADLTLLARRHDVDFTSMSAVILYDPFVPTPEGVERQSSVRFTCKGDPGRILRMKRSLDRVRETIDGPRPAHSGVHPAVTSPCDEMSITVRGTDRENVVLDLINMLSVECDAHVFAFDAKVSDKRTGDLTVTTRLLPKSPEQLRALMEDLSDWLESNQFYLVAAPQVHTAEIACVTSDRPGLAYDAIRLLHDRANVEVSEFIALSNEDRSASLYIHAFGGSADIEDLNKHRKVYLERMGGDGGGVTEVYPAGACITVAGNAKQDALFPILARLGVLDQQVLVRGVHIESIDMDEAEQIEDQMPPQQFLGVERRISMRLFLNAPSTTQIDHLITELQRRARRSRLSVTREEGDAWEMFDALKQRVEAVVPTPETGKAALFSAVIDNEEAKEALAYAQAIDTTAPEDTILPSLIDIEKLKVQQHYERYTDENHEVWGVLYQRRMEQLRKDASNVFLRGIDAIGLTPDRVPDLRDVNQRLSALTGWGSYGVPGFLPAKAFFAFLAKRQFPTTITVRPKTSMDYLPEPDIIHDVFGHVPLHADPVFAEFLHEFGRAALHADSLVVEDQDVSEVDRLGRLFWFTVEYGLIREDGRVKLFGAGLMSSDGEGRHALDPEKVEWREFDLERVMSTDYEIDHYQPVLYVLDSFEQLRDAMRTYTEQLRPTSPARA